MAESLNFLNTPNYINTATNITLNSKKRKILTDNDSVNCIIIKSKYDLTKKIKMNFKNLKIKIEENFDNLKNFTLYCDYFQSKTLRYTPVFSIKYQIFSEFI